MHGRCLVCSCNRNGQNYISVVLGADTKKFRTKDSIQIIEYAYANYKTISLKEKVEETFENWKKENEILIQKGKEQTVIPKIQNIEYELYPLKQEEKISVQIECETKLEAPVEEGKRIGKISVIKGKEKIMEIPIVTANSVSKKEPADYWKQIWIKFKL